ncbi:MAG: hypothetical protein AB7P99_10145 [Vicinamibacterales bacterium]
MADFPGSIFAPTTKNPGDTIQPSHINALQDEVVAIETGYRQATAPLNSSGSTVTSLSVVGGSTLAGTLTVGGATVLSSGLTVAEAATFNGSVTFNGPIALPSPPRVKVSNAATTTIGASGTWVGMSWDTEVYDSTGLHSTATNSSRVLLTSSGLWAFGANIAAAGNVFLNAEARVMLNDASALANNISNAATSALFPVNVTGVHYASDTTDYITVQVQSQSNSGSLQGNSTTYAVVFWAQRLT